MRANSQMTQDINKHYALPGFVTACMGIVLFYSATDLKWARQKQNTLTTT